MISACTKLYIIVLCLPDLLQLQWRAVEVRRVGCDMAQDHSESKGESDDRGFPKFNPTKRARCISATNSTRSISRADSCFSTQKIAKSVLVYLNAREP